MDKVALAQKLRETLDSASPHVVEAHTEAAAIPREFAAEETWFLHLVSRRIAEFLATEESFKPGRGFLIQQANGWTGFHANEASIALCRRVVGGQTPEQAVEWLEKVVNTRTADGLGVLALSGLTVVGRIDFGSGLSLIPFDALPESNTKRWIAATDEANARSFRVSHQVESAPTAALTFAHAVTPYLWPAHQGPVPIQRDPHYCQVILNDARLVLSLVGPSAPLSLGFWFEFVDSDLADASVYGGVTMSHQEINPFGFLQSTLVLPYEATTLLAAFQSVAEPLKTTLRLSLQRFNQAMLRPAHGDRAIELAIALESLLVDGSGENTFKLGLRAALLLGGSVSERLRVRALISALYVLRSSLIHDGVLPREVKLARGGKRPAHEVVAESTDVCARILRRVVTLGAIPDWYEFEVGTD